MTVGRCLKGMEYLHATFIFAMFVPFVYAVTEWSDPAGTMALYLKCLLAAVPVIVTERAAKKTKNVFTYFVISLLLLAGMGGLSGWIISWPGGKEHFEGYEICYVAVMLAETFMISVKRFVDRVRAAKQKREEPLAAAVTSFLDCPALSLVWYFVVLYVLGLCLNAKLLCDIAFYSAILYTFLALFYEYIESTMSYLEINKRTRGIPRRRLYGISLSMLLVFVALLLAGMMPAVFMAGQRQYTNIRDWFGDVELVPYEYESDAGFQKPAAGGADMMELLRDGEPAPEPSKVAGAVLWVFGAVCVLFFLYGIFCAIKQILQDFRNSHDENGDIIEELEDDQLLRQKEEHTNKKGFRSAESEAERIRRRYRKTIRKHRKERPAPYESPMEIETYAGLKDDEQMQQLHRQYEQVRYGKM